MLSRAGTVPEQLARDSRLHWSYLGQVERGQRNLTLHNILKLAEVLGVDPATWSAASALPEGGANGADDPPNAFAPRTRRAAGLLARSV
jgi:transcriptional regulator with XRE-family HTH domain